MERFNFLRAQLSGSNNKFLDCYSNEDQNYMKNVYDNKSDSLSMNKQFTQQKNNNEIVYNYNHGRNFSTNQSMPNRCFEDTSRRIEYSSRRPIERNNDLQDNKNFSVERTSSNSSYHASKDYNTQQTRNGFQYDNRTNFTPNQSGWPSDNSRNIQHNRNSAAEAKGAQPTTWKTYSSTYNPRNDNNLQFDDRRNLDSNQDMRGWPSENNRNMQSNDNYVAESMGTQSTTWKTYNSTYNPRNDNNLQFDNRRNLVSNQDTSGWFLENNRNTQDDTNIGAKHTAWNQNNSNYNNMLQTRNQTGFQYDDSRNFGANQTAPNHPSVNRVDWDGERTRNLPEEKRRNLSSTSNQYRSTFNPSEDYRRQKIRNEFEFKYDNKTDFDKSRHVPSRHVPTNQDREIRAGRNREIRRTEPREPRTFLFSLLIDKFLKLNYNFNTSKKKLVTLSKEERLEALKKSGFEREHVSNIERYIDSAISLAKEKISDKNYEHKHFSGAATRRIAYMVQFGLDRATAREIETERYFVRHAMLDCKKELYGDGNTKKSLEKMKSFGTRKIESLIEEKKRMTKNGDKDEMINETEVKTRQYSSKDISEEKRKRTDEMKNDNVILQKAALRRLERINIRRNSQRASDHIRLSGAQKRRILKMASMGVPKLKATRIITELAVRKRADMENHQKKNQDLKIEKSSLTISFLLKPDNVLPTPILLKRLEQQNVGLNTEKWDLIECQKETTDAEVLTFNIDKESRDFLQRQKCTLIINLSKFKIKFIPSLTPNKT